MQYLMKGLALQINPRLHRVTAWSLYTLPRIDIRSPISDHHLRRPSACGAGRYLMRTVSAVFRGGGGWETEAKEAEI